MNPRLLIRFGLIALVLVVGYFQKEKIGGQPVPNPAPVAAQAGGSTLPPLKTELKSPQTPAAKSSSSLIIKNLQIRDVDGRIAYRGDVDLKPALERIRAGRRDPHSNDGAVFGNRERRLPQKERGYYTEYVVRTPGISHAGPQRLVIGKQGEIFYTFDHYQTFQKIQP